MQRAKTNQITQYFVVDSQSQEIKMKQSTTRSL